MNENKQIFIIACVMFVLGLLLGYYLFSGTNVSDVSNTVTTVKKQYKDIEARQQEAAGAINRAEKASQNIASGIDDLETSLRKSAAIINRTEAILNEIGETGKVN